jgi:ABC-type uncharacterized transport system substrate-binding protein
VKGDSEEEMKKKVTVFTVSVLLYAFCLSAEAQQTGKIPRIGFLEATSASTIPARLEAFRQGLLELGYVEGENIHIDLPVGGGKVRSAAQSCI